MDIEAVIRAYLPSISHMSLATVRDGVPWVCELRYSYDEDLALYFRSPTNRRHSAEIADNPRVAGNIVVQHNVEEKPRGVYFEGTAELLDDVTENHPAYISYSARFNKDARILEEAQTDTGAKFYKITVHTFYVFDAQASNPPQKYELAWVK